MNGTVSGIGRIVGHVTDLDESARPCIVIFLFPLLEIGTTIIICFPDVRADSRLEEGKLQLVFASMFWGLYEIICH